MTGEQLKNGMAVRFEVEPNTGCWLWKAKGIYGRCRLNGSMMDAHRASWIAHFGSIPVGLCVLHHCDTPGCVNPQHLFLGTQKDNITDKVMKDRVPKGRSHYKFKLDRSKIATIEFFETMGFYQSEIAEMVGLSQGRVCVALRRGRVNLSPTS